MRAAPVALVVAIAAFAAAAVFAPRDLLEVSRDVRNAYATPRGERAYAPATQVGILEPGAVAAAAAVVPRSDAYAVATDASGPLRDARSADYVKFWATFTLLPRRRADRAEEADWVLAYGGRADALGIRYSRVVTVGPGVSVVEVRR